MEKINKNKLRKLNKRAALDQIVATVFFIAAFALIVSVFFFTTNSNPVEQKVDAIHIKLDDEESFSNLMQSYTDATNSETMTDLIVQSLVINQYSRFDTVLSAKMRRDYDKGIYWEYAVFKIDKNTKYDTSKGEILYEFRNTDFKAPDRLPQELETMARFNSDPFGENPSVMYIQLPFVDDSYKYYMVFSFGGSKFRGDK